MPGMSQFLVDVRDRIDATPGKSVAGLAAELDLSRSQAWRILTGKAELKPWHMAIMRKYVGIGDLRDRTGKELAVIEFVELQAANSFEKEEDVICNISLHDEMLPVNIDKKKVKIIRVISDHCSPDYKLNDFALVDTGQVTPEPSGVFLIWTGLGFKFQHCSYIVGSSPASVRLSSKKKGPEYDAVEVPLSKIKIKGRIIGKLALL